MSNDGPTEYGHGMILDILYSPIGNFSNGGVSSRCQQVTVTRVVKRTGQPGPGAMLPVPRECRVFAPTDERPEAVLVVRRIGEETVLHVSPWTAGGPGQAMMGGCYVAASDSRWSELIRELLGHGFYGALALHDRWE